MKNQFIPYHLALKLNELGFNQECFAHYMTKGAWQMDLSEGSFFYKRKPDNDKSEYSVNAPLWQQAFDWFREEHGYFSSPTESDNDEVKKYDWSILKNLGEGEVEIKFVGYHDTYEQAKLACLEKLCELKENE